LTFSVISIAAKSISGSGGKKNERSLEEITIKPLFTIASAGNAAWL